MVAARVARQVGRYTLFREIGAGGMATVHLARLTGAVGFSRVVAVKHVHPHLVRAPEVGASFIEAVRLAARIRHPNVVPILDVVVDEPDIYLVMEYVEGETLGRLAALARQRREAIPFEVSAAIMVDALSGLHAAHQAPGSKGRPLERVHRDVSPSNVLVGVDGVARLIDFGLTQAMGAALGTPPGALEGTSSYMAPEQARGEALTRQADIFAASALFWELLTGRRLFGGTSEQARRHKVLSWDNRVAPSAVAPDVPRALDAVLARGLANDPRQRYGSAAQMAEAISTAVPFVSRNTVGEWVAELASESLARRSALVKHTEAASLEAEAGAAVPAPELPDAVERPSRVFLGGTTSAPVSARLAARPPGWLRLAGLAGALAATVLGLVLAFRSTARHAAPPVGPAISLQALTATPLPITPARAAVVPPARPPTPQPPPPARTAPAEVAPELPAEHHGTAAGPLTRRRWPGQSRRSTMAESPPELPSLAAAPPSSGVMPAPAEPEHAPPRRAPLVDDSGRAPLVE
jgi:hypothetical protein